jgi:hypothetical protein
LSRAKQAICAIAVYLAAIPAVCADDAVLNWPVQNNYTGPLQLGFYAQDRGIGWQYLLAEHERRVFRLQCVAGETVCIGAWPADEINVRWGVGANASFSCSDCCVTCGGEAPREWKLGDTDSQYETELLAYADCNARTAAEYSGQEGEPEALAKAAEIACGEEKRLLAEAITQVSGVEQSVAIVDNLEQIAVRNNAERIGGLKAEQSSN